MENKTPKRPKESLIERAARVYGLDTQHALEARPEPDVRPDAPERGAVVDQAQPPVGPSRSQQDVRSSRRKHAAQIDQRELGKAGFITSGSPVNIMVEEFRIVKRQLLLNAFGGKGREAVDHGRIILVTSSQPNEGKTFCSVNLALSIATEREIEVLLVDGDFSKPEILTTLGLKGDTGLIDAIADPAINIEDCIIHTDVPNLSVLPAGRITSEVTELLTSKRTSQIFDQLEARQDRIVIIDSAPLLAVTQASVLAYSAGQTVMVVRADTTREAELRESLAMLSGCKHVSLLLNGTTFVPHGRPFGAYYGYGA